MEETPDECLSFLLFLIDIFLLFFPSPLSAFAAPEVIATTTAAAAIADNYRCSSRSRSTAATNNTAASSATAVDRRSVIARLCFSAATTIVAGRLNGELNGPNCANDHIGIVAKYGLSQYGH